MEKQDIKQQSEKNFRKLLEFNPTLISVSPSLDKEEIEEFENVHQLLLPADYKFFLTLCNGFSLLGHTVFGINKSNSNPEEDLLNIYIREHREVDYPMLDHLIPFSPNGRGDHYCFNTLKLDKNSMCPVVFWQWDYSYFHKDDIDETNPSFTSWLTELIDEILEDYTYDGEIKVK